MGYVDKLSARHIAGRAIKPRGGPAAVEVKHEGMPFYYAVLMVLFFLVLTKGQGDLVLPSIVIPLVLWLFIRHRG